MNDWNVELTSQADEGCKLKNFSTANICIVKKNEEVYDRMSHVDYTKVAEVDNL